MSIMRKKILFGVLALLISAGVTSQTTEPLQEQIKTKKQLRTETKQQTQIRENIRSGDPDMTRTRTREQIKLQDQSGDPIMTKDQIRLRSKRQLRDQSCDPAMTQQARARTSNHGLTVSKTARQTPGGKGKGGIASAQARQVHRNMSAARGARTGQPIVRNAGRR